MRLNGNTRELLLVIYCILIESLQVLVIATVISNYFPVDAKDFVAQNFAKEIPHQKLNRQVDLFRLFVVTNIFLAVIFAKKGIHRIKDQQWVKEIFRYAFIQTVLLAVQLFATFKLIVHKSPPWASVLFWCALGAAVVSRFFWPEIRRFLHLLYEKFIVKGLSQKGRIGFDLGVIASVFVLLYIPDLQKALAKIFIWGRMLDWDHYLLAPGWEYLNGGKLNLDVHSSWGSVAPVLMSWISKFTGGFDYAHVLWWSMVLMIVYFISCYFFLRYWLRSPLLAFGSILLAIKLQLFNAGAAPFIWIYPQKTVLRYLPDIAALFLLASYNRDRNPKALLGAAIAVGASLAYMIDTGLALVIAFYSYLVFLMNREKLPIKWAFVLPWVVAFSIIFLVQGERVFDFRFWQDTFEPMALLFTGIKAVPFYDCLRGLQFFAFVMQFIIPGVYLMTVLVAGAFVFLNRISGHNFLAAVIAIYGLALYPDFLWQSSLNNYYSICIPFVFILAYWLDILFKFFSPSHRRMALLIWIVLTGGGLLTNELLMVYPNALGIASHDWSSEVKIYQDNFNFDKDAGMIRSQTAADDEIVLVSSFETQMLMRAHRKSFFNRVPLIETVHMGMAQFGGTNIYTVPELQSVLARLDQAKPTRVFVEKKLMTGQLPKEYYQYYQSLTALLMYFQEHYQLEQEGQYLLQLKRR